MDLSGNLVKFFEKTKRNEKAEDRKEQFCSNISEYKLNMFRLAKGILHNDADAEDAVGEAIVRAYGNLHTLRNMGSFKPWIMKILINEAYNISNRRKKLLCIDEMEIPVKADPHDDKELWNVVKGLEDELRTVTILFYYEDLSLKDICSILSLPMGTVKSRLFRARKRLREILDGEGSYEDE